MTCIVFYNMLLGQSHEDVQPLLKILQTKGVQNEVKDDKTK